MFHLITLDVVSRYSAMLTLSKVAARLPKRIPSTMTITSMAKKLSWIRSQTTATSNSNVPCDCCPASRTIGTTHVPDAGQMQGEKENMKSHQSQVEGKRAACM